MTTTMHYAAPPGWQPRARLPVLHRTAALEVAEPDPIPDPSDPYARFGLRWQAYLAGLVAATLLMLAAAASGWATVWQVPALCASVAWALCVHGLCDYARAAAAEARRQVGR